MKFLYLIKLDHIVIKGNSKNLNDPFIENRKTDNLLNQKQNTLFHPEQFNYKNVNNLNHSNNYSFNYNNFEEIPNEFTPNINYPNLEKLESDANNISDSFAKE